MIRWLAGALVLALFAARGTALAATVVVPTDQATIQGAVNAAGDGGTVIINSNATFDETITVTTSLTIHGGVGFAPTLRGSSLCNGFPCTLFFHPNSAAPQMLAISDLRLVPKTGTRGTTRFVVRVLNQGSADATLIFANCSIDNPDGFGFQAVEIRRASCSAGLNHVSMHSGSIDMVGADEGFAGQGGFDMPEGGSLAVSNMDLTMSGMSAQIFRLALTPNCGQILFDLRDSRLGVVSTTSPFSADVAFLLLGVTATIERNTFNVMSVGEGSAAGIRAGGGSGAMYAESITLDANDFSGAGPHIGTALAVGPFANGSVTVAATNNVVRDMHAGFRLGQPIGNPAGTVAATLTNNTVDGSVADAVSLNFADGAAVSIAMDNNLLTNSGGWGVAVETEPGGTVAASVDYSGFFANAAGNVQAPLVPGAHDVVGDPIYVNRAQGQLFLGFGSPMLNAGNNTAVATATDAAGALRIQDGIVDIGAFEGAFAVTVPTDTPTPTPTASATTPSTATATHTPSASRTATRTASASRTATPAASATATGTAAHTQPPAPTASPASSPTASSSRTATTATSTPTSPSTATLAATASPTASPPRTPTRTAQPCVGDCNGSGVGITELVTMVNIALGRAPVSACTAGDPDGNGRIDIAELLKAVNSALRGCG